MDIFKNISDKIFGVADNISKKTDNYIELGELMFDIRLLEREITERKYLLGEYIYHWYSNKDFDIREIPRICKEIMERENEIRALNNKIKKSKK